MSESPAPSEGPGPRPVTAAWVRSGLALNVTVFVCEQVDREAHAQSVAGKSD